MKSKLYFGAFLLSVLILAACSDDSVDDVYPVIDMSASGSFPQNCVVVSRGQTFVFKALFTDNKELGSYSINIHNNFDHHNHTTEISECEMDPVKIAVNPFLHIQEYTIPEGSTSYEANTVIAIPADVDAGNYHFVISLTDREGCEVMKGISIRIE